MPAPLRMELSLQLTVAGTVAGTGTAATERCRFLLPLTAAPVSCR